MQTEQSQTLKDKILYDFTDMWTLKKKKGIDRRAE